MKTVFFDVDTQLDFVYPAGALYVPGAGNVIANVAKLNRWAASHGVPVVSTMDAHTENDPEFLHWPSHCVVGTIGQHKPAETVLDSRVVVPWRAAKTDVTGASQIIVEKRVLDCFQNPNLGNVLEALGAERYVVYGVVTEICVKFAALGLLKTGKPVVMASDAVRRLNEVDESAMIREFEAAGGRRATTAEITI